MRRTTISHFSFLIQARLSNGIKGWHAPRANQQSKKRTVSMLHHDEKTYHQDRHKETIEELPPERLPILLCRDLEAAMRAILQPSDIRHRTTAMRTHLAVPRRILRALLRRQLRQDFHRRIQKPAPTRRAETEHIPLIHPPAPSAPHPPAAAAPAPDDTPDIGPSASASHARSTGTSKNAATTPPGSPPPAPAKALKATYKRSPSPGSPPSSGHHSVRT